MRLLNPAPGEVLDRTSILELKIQAADKSGKDPSKFIAEKTSLEEYLQKWDQWLKEDKPPVGTWHAIAEKKNGLAAVNALLWDAEDQVRASGELEIAKLALLCKRIAKLNDTRAELVRELSILYKAGDDGEKIYGVAIGRAVAK